MLAFARRFPNLTWQPSDTEPAALASIAAWREAEGPLNLLAPLPLDVHEASWPIESAAAVVAINLLHIAPWSAAEGLITGASRLLVPGALLYLYGPFLEAEVETAPSNLAFDASLRARDPAWGLREVQAVAALAGRFGFAFERRVFMPANNLSLLFRREANR